MSFAMRIASFSSLNAKTGATGPNVSSRATSMFGRHLRDHRRLEERAAERVPLAAERDLARPWPSASAMCSSTLATALASISGPWSVAPCSPSPTRSLRTASTSLATNCVVDAFLHEQAVGADAGLPGVAVLARDRALHGGVEIRVVEHDERRVAAELERHLLQRAGALRHQLLADLGRAGERELAHDRVRRHLAADHAWPGR